MLILWKRWKKRLVKLLNDSSELAILQNRVVAARKIVTSRNGVFPVILMLKPLFIYVI
jgi:hypothetical protein